jgi:periodic tryptophan protein 2
MPPNLSYRLKRVCGSVYTNGNIIFTPDGNSILSPVGNRVTIIDLLQQNCITLPFESRKNIKRLCISNK